jgi:hypothetical protein
MIAAEKDNHKLFSWLILEIPAFTPAVWDIIKQYCEHQQPQQTSTPQPPPRSTVGLAALRDIILQRTPYRREALVVLLSYTYHSGKKRKGITWPFIHSLDHLP